MIASTTILTFAFLPIVFGANINVQVGAGGDLAYDPEWINANPGDVVTFNFNPKNHTVTQSSFDTPCVSSGGFKTGFVPVSAGISPLPVKQFTVPEGNAPLWFYCGQVGHCGQGMVFAINPPADPSPNSFNAFKALAVAQNGTAATSAAAATTSAYVTPPAPHWQSATATVTFNNSVYTTTYSSYDGTPPPTPTAVPIDHKIVVGIDGQLAYGPSNISASIGDTVTFEFHPKNHTVTQSNFLNPCEPLQASTGTAGFKSGFRPVAADDTTFPTFTITINDTAPIWGYCGQVGHCAAGMVFSINAVESGPNNFDAFVSLAKQSNQTSASSAASTGGSATATATSASSTGTGTSASKSRGFVSSEVSLPVTLGAAFFGLLALLL